MSLIKKWPLFLVITVISPVLSATPLFNSRGAEFNSASTAFTLSRSNNGTPEEGREPFKEQSTLNGENTDTEEGVYSWMAEGPSTDLDGHDSSRYISDEDDYARELNTQDKTIATENLSVEEIIDADKPVVTSSTNNLALVGDDNSTPTGVQTITVKTRFVLINIAPTKKEMKTLGTKIAIWVNDEGQIRLTKLGFEENSMTIKDEILLHTTEYTVPPDKLYTLRLESTTVYVGITFQNFEMCRISIQEEDAEEAQSYLLVLVLIRMRSKEELLLSATGFLGLTNGM